MQQETHKSNEVHEILKHGGVSMDADNGEDNPKTIWDNPLFLPAGSVRSLIALLIVFSTIIIYYKTGIIPDKLADIMFVVVGFYFGSKTK